MAVSKTPVSSNVARPREEIGWLIEASEGEGDSDKPVSGILNNSEIKRGDRGRFREMDWLRERQVVSGRGGNREEEGEGWVGSIFCSWNGFVLRNCGRRGGDEKREDWTNIQSGSFLLQSCPSECADRVCLHHSSLIRQRKHTMQHRAGRIRPYLTRKFHKI